MEFSTLLFIYAFLPISVIVYYLLPKKFRNAVLLITSVVFTAMSGLYFFAFMAAYTAINYVFGILIAKTGKNKPISFLFTFLGTAADVSLFFLFRSELFSTFSAADKITELVMPIGLSFLTLSAVGYLIDVYRDSGKAEYSFFRFSLFIFMFTKLPAGPLVSCHEFSDMLKKRSEGINAVGEGLEKFTIGLAKKVLLADNIYRLYSAAAAIKVTEMSALSAWLGTAAYMLCIYFTLSGISDMGQGLSLCFGFRFPDSFDYPCVSFGVNDFGKKWHIPVVKWFNDYFIEPFGRRISKKFLGYSALIIMWIMVALWYEVSLNKLICGLIIGFSIAIERITSERNSGGKSSVIYTFFILSLSTIFFFGDSIGYSFFYFLAMIGGNNNIADSLSLYLLKNYSVLILAGLLFASGVRKKLLHYKAAKTAENLLSPVVTLFLLIVCTAVISYSGSAGSLLIKL